MRSSFRVIWKILNFTMLSHSPLPPFGFSLLERNPRTPESETAAAAIFGGNK
jgi:hypothetical protein